MSVNPPQGGVCLCVLGMHRSGTSALMRLLDLLGVEIGSDLWPAGPDNPTGFWESRPIVQTHDELLDSLQSAFDDFWPLPDGWETRAEIQPIRKKLIDMVRSQLAVKPLWGFKDPRTCRLVPLWRTIFNELGTSPRYVVLMRHPREIAGSLAAQNGMSINHALLMTMEHVRAAELSTRSERRVLVTYDQLLTDWRATAARIAHELGITWPVPIEQAETAVAAFLDPGRRHQRAGSRQAESLADPRLLDRAQRQHEILAQAAAGKKLSTRALDRVGRRLVGDLVRHAGWRDTRSARREIITLTAWAAERTRAIEFLTSENRYFRNKLGEPPADPSDPSIRPHATH